MENAAIKILHNTFGYSEFRGHQEAIISSLCAGEDALVLMPTGGGKSLCYQIPMLIRPGLGVVVSPLIALMEDQVSALRELGVNARFLNSTLNFDEMRQIEQDIRKGDLQMLYIAPERLLQERTLQLLLATTISLFAIDEAHCVSQWGHDFRADYLQLDVLQEQFPNVPRVALTATADEQTRQEILSRLGLEQARIFISSFDRPNIRYRINLRENGKQQLLRFLKHEHPDDAGIVYCLSRKKVEDTARWLSEQGFRALPYHAGLPLDSRKSHQQQFLREDGIIIVATVAFGMGIDKPDVRFVAHLDLPKSVEAYYQETGRAGRDGRPSTAWMVYGLQDVIKLKNMREDSSASEAFKRIESHRLNAMLGLCEITSCRRQAIVDYFNDTQPVNCNNCDNCVHPVETWDATEAARKALSCIYRTGQRFGVSHLVDVLRGQNNEKIRQFGHQNLSTYGIGRELTAEQWRSVYRQLIARNYIHVDMDMFGAFKLTQKCRPLLRGEEQIDLRKDKRSKKDTGRKRSSANTLVNESQAALWNLLRQKRKALAEQQGVPPYVIFGDAALMEMMEKMPVDEKAFLAINGVGQHKLDKYGKDFLQVIASHKAQARTANKAAKGDSYKHSLSLFRQGFKIPDIAEQRALKEQTIYRHMEQAIQNGEIGMQEVIELPDEQLDRIREALFAHADESNRIKLGSVFNDLDGDYSHEVLACVRAELMRG